MAKHHSNQLNDQERLVLLEWIDASEENMRAFTQSVMVLERERERERENRGSKGRRVVLWGLSAAAVVVLGILLFSPEKPVSEQLMAFTMPVERRFEDSTDVTLQPQSALTFTKKSDNHFVYSLSKGRARFEMHKQPMQTIEVNTAGMTIVDIGTTFDVENQGDTLIFVHVTEGTVECTTPHAHQTIAANQKYRYSIGKKQFESMQPHLPNVHSADVLRFHFDNTSLDQVMAQLSDAYDVDIQLSGAIGDCSLSVDFDQEALSTILGVICETMNLTMATTENGYILSGNGCE